MASNQFQQSISHLLQSFRICLPLCLLLFSSFAAPLRAEEQLPAELKNVGIDPTLGITVPLNLTFTDEAGKPVQFSSFFKKDKPVILALVYYECPMLCTLVLNGLTDGLKGLPWTAGDQFEIATISFNPKETPALASAKKASYLQELGRPKAATGWHFLVGAEDQIKPLAASVGFKYAWDPAQKQYAHATGIFILSPTGKLTRTLYGIDYPSRDLRLALTEAAEGKVGTVIDKIMLFCYHYDPQKKGYSVAAWRVMQLAGSVTAIGLFAIIGSFLMIERRQRRRAAAARTPTEGNADPEPQEAKKE